MDMIKVGPAGGSCGIIWDHKGRDQVAGVIVSYNTYAIASLEFLYYENSKLVPSNKHGFEAICNLSSCAVVFDYPSEFLTSISGSFRSTLNTIKFGTNKGSYGPFGCTSPSTDDKDFNFQIGNHRLFGGFHGTNRGWVESIGIYVKTIISPMINWKDPRIKSEKEED